MRECRNYVLECKFVFESAEIVIVGINFIVLLLKICFDTLVF